MKNSNHKTKIGIKRRSLFGDVLDWMRDRNDCTGFTITVSTTIPCSCGSCGPPPDVAAMLNEKVDEFDLAADEAGLFGKDRLNARHFHDLQQKCQRDKWLRDQAIESSKTFEAPMDEMTPEEIKKFLGYIEAIKKSRVQSAKRWQREQKLQAQLKKSNRNRAA